MCDLSIFKYVTLISDISAWIDKYFFRKGRDKKNEKNTAIHEHVLCLLMIDLPEW